MESITSYTIKGKQVFVVSNPIECMDFNHLHGHVAMIDGDEYMIVGIERFAHTPPWRAGEEIGLIVLNNKENNNNE